VWVELALIAADQLALAQTMLLTDDPDLAKAEPKTLRYRLLHIAARITRGQRKVFLRLAEHWPGPKHSLACGTSRSRPDRQHHQDPAATTITETPDPAPALTHASAPRPQPQSHPSAVQTLLKHGLGLVGLHRGRVDDARAGRQVRQRGLAQPEHGVDVG